MFHQNRRRSTDRRLFLPDLRRERIPRADTVGHFDVRRGDVRHAVRSEYMASDGAAGEYHGTESVFFEQVAALRLRLLRLYAEHPAYDGQLLVVCFQNIAAAERVVDHLRRIEMLPQVDVEDLIMSRCAKNGTVPILCRCSPLFCFEIMRQLMSVLIDTQRYQMEMLSGNVIMLENNIRLISISHTFHILLGGFP